MGANLANVDTPGYIRQDISFGQYLSTMNSPLETRLSEKLGPSAVISEQSEDPINPANELYRCIKIQFFIQWQQEECQTLLQK